MSDICLQLPLLFWIKATMSSEWNCVHIHVIYSDRAWFLSTYREVWKKTGEESSPYLKARVRRNKGALLPLHVPSVSSPLLSSLWYWITSTTRRHNKVITGLNYWPTPELPRSSFMEQLCRRQLPTVQPKLLCAHNLISIKKIVH